MDEEKVARAASTVGERLKAARTKKKMSLEDIAAQTRIPLRHLEAVEESAWDRLPAPTYTIGFAKAYAGAVGLDRAEISEQLREELGGSRYTSATVETFEPADPARSMPKWLVIGGIAAVLLVVLALTWLNNRALNTSDEPAVNAEAGAPAAGPPPLTAPTVQGPVVLSATEPVWVAVKERSGETYFAGILKPGTDFTVPPNATAPLLSTARPEALKISVGTAVAPPVGAPGSSVTDVSLLGADLLRGGTAPVVATPPTLPPPPAPTQRRATSQRRTAPPPEPAPPPAPAPAPETPVNATGE